MNNAAYLIKAAKAASPYLKPLGIKIGKKICEGTLTALASKYAMRIVGNHILAQRDRDIRMALQQSVELKRLQLQQAVDISNLTDEEAIEVYLRNMQYK